METIHRRALITLALSGAAAVGLWATLGRDRPAEEEDEPAHDEGTDEAPSPPRAAAPSDETERGSEPQPRAFDTGSVERAEPEAPQPDPNLLERYPSPYAGESPQEERRLLELTIDHQEKMLEFAEQRLQVLEAEADESDDAEDEYEAQRQAIAEGRAQTEAFKQRLRQLKGER